MRRGTLTNLGTGALKERIYHSNEIASTSSPAHFREGGGGKITPEKVGDAPRQFVRICRSFILPLLYSTQSLSRPLSSSRGSYRQFSSSSSSRARAAPTPQRYSKHTQQSSPTLPLSGRSVHICRRLSLPPPRPQLPRCWTCDI